MMKHGHPDSDEYKARKKHRFSDLREKITGNSQSTSNEQKLEERIAKERAEERTAIISKINASIKRKNDLEEAIEARVRQRTGSYEIDEQRGAAVRYSLFNERGELEDAQ